MRAEIGAAAVCRELTKLHEEIRRGTLAELAAGAAETPPRGEVTIVVAGAAGRRRRRGPARLRVERRRHRPASSDGRVDELVATGMRRSDAIRRVATEAGLPRRAVYRVTALEST